MNDTAFLCCSQQLKCLILLFMNQLSLHHSDHHRPYAGKCWLVKYNFGIHLPDGQKTKTFLCCISARPCHAGDRPGFINVPRTRAWNNYSFHAYFKCRSVSLLFLRNSRILNSTSESHWSENRLERASIQAASTVLTCNCRLVNPTTDLILRLHMSK